jgi:hypothetical protein
MGVMMELVDAIMMLVDYLVPPSKMVTMTPPNSCRCCLHLLLLPQRIIICPNDHQRQTFSSV